MGYDLRDHQVNPVTQQGKHDEQGHGTRIGLQQAEYSGLTCIARRGGCFFHGPVVYFYFLCGSFLSHGSLLHDDDHYRRQITSGSMIAGEFILLYAFLQERDTEFRSKIKSFDGLPNLKSVNLRISSVSERPTVCKKICKNPLPHLTKKYFW